MLGLALLAAAGQPVTFKPGYVDPRPSFVAAARAIGADRIRCLTARGTAYGGRLGQQRYVKVEGDWPVDRRQNFSLHMSREARAMLEEFDRAPGQTPASYQYGAGWTGGSPSQALSPGTATARTVR